MRPYLGPPWTDSCQMWCVVVLHHALPKYEQNHENAENIFLMMSHFGALLQCNNLTYHENCTPWWYFLLENTYASKPLAHKAVLIPPLYTIGTHHFPVVSISSYTWIFWRKVNFHKCKKNIKKSLREVEILSFFAITFLITVHHLPILHAELVWNTPYTT